MMCLIEKIVISHLDFDFVKGAKVCNSKSNTKSNSSSNKRHQKVRDHKSMLGLLALVHIGEAFSLCRRSGALRVLIIIIIIIIIMIIIIIINIIIIIMF